MRGARTAALLLLLPVLALAACGGDDGGNGGSSSEQEFAKKANKVCNDVERELDELGGGNATSANEIAELIDNVIVQSRAAVERLKRIERPEGSAGETAEKFVNTLDDEIEDRAVPALEDLRDAIREEDRQAAADAGKRLQELEGAESDRLASELGATACSGGS
jgi:hypothetical protein